MSRPIFIYLLTLFAQGGGPAPRSAPELACRDGKLMGCIDYFAVPPIVVPPVIAAFSLDFFALDISKQPLELRPVFLRNRSRARELTSWAALRAVCVHTKTNCHFLASREEAEGNFSAAMAIYEPGCRRKKDMGACWNYAQHSENRIAGFERTCAWGYGNGCVMAKYLSLDKQLLAKKPINIFTFGSFRLQRAVNEKPAGASPGAGNHLTIEE